jgi:hypothetical protein
MCRKDSGFIELGALLVLLFFAAAAAGALYFVSANARYIQRSKNDFQNRLEAENILARIIRDMQALSGYENDYRSLPVLEELRGRYGEYGLEIEDISSGYHLDFLPDKDLAEANLAEFFFKSGNASDFIRFRALHGLSGDIEPWKDFIKEEALAACVCLGWIHTKHAGSFAYNSMCFSFGTTNPEDLFPVVNNFPMMNVNMIKPNILKPLVKRAAFKIAASEEKLKNLTAKLSGGPVTEADICSVFAIPPDHEIFIYIGTKTAFWGIRFSTKARYSVRAVIAAIPRKNGKPQEVDEYKMVGRSIQHEG